MEILNINENNDYTVSLSQTEINLLNELLAFVNPYKGDFPLVKETFQSLSEVINEVSTFEFEEVFTSNINISKRGNTIILEDFEIVPTKDLFEI